MEIKIGVQQAQRELVVESEASADEVQKLVADALTAGGVLTLSDTKGRTVVVPVEKLAYVEIGGGVAGQVGFRS
ncbi:DUF3107 domain-containing protein [Nocardioides aestuarii]|uniref:DUF3107 domain-containing protein n=1 Tax=Nocardioides aestuarii TaxID=252231 RepID=A0ABW4TT72_9ACTN